MPPLDDYYKGSGDRVMKSMRKRYGKRAGKRVFYATANKTGMNPKRKKSRASGRR